MNRRCTPWLLAACATLGLGGAAARPSPVDVIPAPKHVVVTSGLFALDGKVAVLLSDKAEEGTARAARVIQRALRARLGSEVPIVRVADPARHCAALAQQAGGRKPIWVVEPGLGLSPARTIGEPGLEFTKPMLDQGYFLRIDAAAVVVHGAGDAGSLYGAHTLAQLMQPAQAGTLVRKGRGPSLPCLWMRDHPAQGVRVLPLDFVPPGDPGAASQFLATMAHYKLNALHIVLLPAGLDAAARFREEAQARHIVFVKKALAIPDTPLGAVAKRWVGEGLAARYAIAALAEGAWGPPDPAPEAFRLRFARLAFGGDAAAEVIALTEEASATPAHRTMQELLYRVGLLANATGDEARQVARARAAHERRARRIRELWKTIQGPPALRAAFRQAAERRLCAADALYALAEARRLHARGRPAAASRVLRTKLAVLRAAGAQTAGELALFRELIQALDAAAKAKVRPGIGDVWGPSK